VQEKFSIFPTGGAKYPNILLRIFWGTYTPYAHCLAMPLLLHVRTLSF